MNRAEEDPVPTQQNMHIMNEEMIKPLLFILKSLTYNAASISYMHKDISTVAEVLWCEQEQDEIKIGWSQIS